MYAMPPRGALRSESRPGSSRGEDGEIEAHLTTAFNKFDTDSSGEMGQWEFTQAWLFLGLKGTEDEINDAFKGEEDHARRCATHFMTMTIDMATSQAATRYYRLPL